jgi:VanZ family protein
MLPANNFPEENIFHIPHQDKILHVIFFFLLVYLFSFPFKNSPFVPSKRKSWFLSIALYGVAYGIVVEFLQKYFVPNRGYDVWDIFADAGGCLFGYLYSRKFFLGNSSKK